MVGGTVPSMTLKLLHNRMTELYRTVPSTTLNCSIPDVTEYSCHVAHLSTCVRPRRTPSILYARRVFIMDGCDELITEWLNCIVDTVDSEDPPLNISRLTLQQNKTLHVIKKNFLKQCLEMFAEIAEKKDDYKKFYKQLGKCLKLGIHVDSTDRTKIAELMRFNTSRFGDEQISLKEYIDRMIDGQNDYYYISDESIAVVSSSLFFENLRKKSLEATHMVDPVDE